MSYVFLLLFALIFVYLARVLGFKLKVIDAPSPNKIHSIPIPRSGGLGIFLTFLLGLILFPNPLKSYELIFLIAISLIGFIDDFISISQKIKFGIEIILAVALSIISSWRFTNVLILDVFFSTFYLVGSINALNEIDGMDGLAGGVALISCLFLSYWLKESSLIVAIACLGFLIWNFHPAKIFMGDGGSLFLGAFIGLLSLKILSLNPSISTLLALIFIYSAPIYDSALTVIRRFYTRTSIFKPDLGHFYNKLYNITKNYIGTVLVIYFFSLILGLIGLFVYNLPSSISILLGVIIWLLLFLLGYKLGFIRSD